MVDKFLDNMSPTVFPAARYELNSVWALKSNTLIEKR
jgi:hypothetical protein